MRTQFFQVVSALLLLNFALFAAEPAPRFSGLDEAEFKKLSQAVQADAGTLEKELANDEALGSRLLANDYEAVMAMAMQAMEKKPSARVALLITRQFSREAGGARFIPGEQRRNFYSTGYE